MGCEKWVVCLRWGDMRVKAQGIPVTALAVDTNMAAFFLLLLFPLISLNFNFLFIWIIIKYYIVCSSIYLLALIYFSFWPVAVSWLAIFSTAFCIYGMCTTCSTFLIGCVCSVFYNTKDKITHFFLKI